MQANHSPTTKAGGRVLEGSQDVKIATTGTTGASLSRFEVLLICITQILPNHAPLGFFGHLKNGCYVYISPLQATSYNISTGQAPDFREYSSAKADTRGNSPRYMNGIQMRAKMQSMDLSALFVFRRCHFF
jgi:hypothetical protein